jgi:hypothetical protein
MTRMIEPTLAALFESVIWFVIAVSAVVALITRRSRP